MKILLVSDTHGRRGRLQDVILKHHHEVSLVIHMGDGANDADDILLDYPALAYVGVKGNCDVGLFTDVPLCRTLSLEGHKLFVCHGHMYGVKTDLDNLAYHAYRSSCDLALFGHTHTPTDKTVSGVHLFNPGSLEHPHAGEPASYGLLELTETNVKFTYHYIEEAEQDAVREWRKRGIRCKYISARRAEAEHLRNGKNEGFAVKTSTPAGRKQRLPQQITKNLPH